MNIATLRTRRKLTQEQLAEKIGVSARYIQSLEAGEYFPSLPKLVKLKLILRCGWNEIFAGCEKI
ncbi:MAG TPA: helix-turn-helix transcriptional regulator [Verrucomicrobiae bacterium]|nr:helix-turn-helix transcriptional regulator [Verrucomicrobiae bacterium]